MKRWITQKIIAFVLRQIRLELRNEPLTEEFIRVYNAGGNLISCVQAVTVKTGVDSDDLALQVATDTLKDVKKLGQTLQMYCENRPLREVVRLSQSVKFPAHVTELGVPPSVGELLIYLLEKR